MIFRRVLLPFLLLAARETHCKDWQSTKHTALARNIFLFNNTVMSDINVTFEESKRKWFYAHEHILASRSLVFNTKFYEAVDSKSVSTVHFSDADEHSVMAFLRFLYTDECLMTSEIAVNVSKLAQRYNILSLTTKCVDVLLANMTAENVFALVDQMRHLESKKLDEKCWNVIDTKTSKALASENFVHITRTTLIDLLKRDTLNIGEVQLFGAVLRWSDHQCSKQNLDSSRKNRRLVLGEAVYELRFLLMSQEEFATIVTPSGLLSDDEIVSIHQRIMGLSNEELKWNITKTRSERTTWLNLFKRVMYWVGYLLICCAVIGWLVVFAAIAKEKLH